MLRNVRFVVSKVWILIWLNLLPAICDGYVVEWSNALNLRATIPWPLCGRISWISRIFHVLELLHLIISCQTLCTSYSPLSKAREVPFKTSNVRAATTSACLAIIDALSTASAPRDVISCVPLISARPSLACNWIGVRLWAAFQKWYADWLVLVHWYIKMNECYLQERIWLHPTQFLDSTFYLPPLDRELNVPRVPLHWLELYKVINEILIEQLKHVSIINGWHTVPTSSNCPLFRNPGQAGCIECVHQLQQGFWCNSAVTFSCLK